MKLSNFFIFLILICFSLNSFLFAQEVEHLKRQDISKIMEKIFSEHLGQKKIDEEILKHSFKIYIDQFDPDRTYLLQEEIKPYIQLSPSQIQGFTTQYKSGNFTSFEKLNAVIQKSILRARDYRKELLKNPEDIFNAAEKLQSSKNNEWLDPDLNRLFASNDTQLKDRIREQMINFIQAEQKRYGKDQVLRYKSKILVLFDNALSNMEDSYLYQTNDGKPFNEIQKENAFVLHVLKSLASSLDAHTAFYSNSEAYDMKVRLEKQFDGIGVVLQQTPEGIIISSLIDGGPASKSGQIYVNDRIVKIDGQPIAGESLPNVMDLMRGAKDSKVELVLSRFIQEGTTQHEKEVTINLKRAPIAVQGERVDVKYEQFGSGIIGMITLHSFYQGEDGTGSETDVRKAIQDLDKKGNLRGLILDLRENSGGFLSQAVKVAGLFISNGVVVVSKYSDGEERVYRDMDGKPAFKGPFIILTSKATASAAEIVAQALQDYGVAIIVGDEHTYGKGTIQSQTITGPEGTATNFFKVTVGKYYTVSGKTPQLKGVKADIVAPGPYSKEHIGEEYLDHPLKPDNIPSDYNDTLQDIDPGLRSWYMKYYTPTVQQKVSTWTSILPTLKKNSAYRMEHNKNYQMFLKELNGGDVDMALFKRGDDEEVAGKDKTNYGHEDLQMQEAVSIIKDMIYLHGKNRVEDLNNQNVVQQQLPAAANK
jgi:carboxyl-terminal processing protease